MLEPEKCCPWEAGLLEITMEWMWFVPKGLCAGGLVLRAEVMEPLGVGA
jgi:hypothetical protein